MDVVACYGGAGFAVISKRLLEFFEKIRLRAEVTEMLVATLRLRAHLKTHFGSVKSMESIALDKDSLHVLPMKYLFERALD
jgi:hypothetical protein